MAPSTRALSWARWVAEVRPRPGHRLPNVSSFIPSVAPPGLEPLAVALTNAAANREGAWAVRPVGASPAKRSLVPPFVEVQGMRAAFAPPYACLQYVFTNTEYPMRTLTLVAETALGWLRRKRHPKRDLLIGEVRTALVESPIPSVVRKRLEKCGNIAHSYSNAIRYEYIHRVCEILFDGIAPNILSGL